MSMNCDITRDEGFLRVRLAGEFSVTEANDCAVNMFESVVEHGIQKVLVDCLQLEGEPTILQRFVHATFAARTMDQFAANDILRSTRFAYVGQEPLINRYTFGASVAINRGIIVKVFSSEDEALEWLKVGPASDTSDNDKR